MRRILIFSLTYHPFVGGAEIAIKEITDRMNPADFTFDLITLRFDRALPKLEKRGNITIYRIGPSVKAPNISDREMPFRIRLAKILFPLLAFVKAFRLDQKYVYDLIWASMANQAGFAALFFKSTHPKTPYLLELQDGRAFGEMKERRPILRFLWPLYRLIYMKADVIKVISSFLEKQVRLIGYTGVVGIIPNGVDISVFAKDPPEEKLRDLKSRFKEDGDVLLFSSSRLVLSRGLEDVIEALTHLPNNVKFLVAGSGEDHAKLIAIAGNFGVSNRVVFVGHIGHEDLPAYYKISDIFVRPSIIEGFGSSFIEAFAAGIPVIATPVGGIPDFLFDPERNPDAKPTGLFCKVRNPGSIAQATRRYMDDPALAGRVVKNAKALVREKYDWDTIATSMRERMFDRLIR